MHSTQMNKIWAGTQAQVALCGFDPNAQEVLR